MSIDIFQVSAETKTEETIVQNDKIQTLPESAVDTVHTDGVKQNSFKTNTAEGKGTDKSDLERNLGILNNERNDGQEREKRFIGRWKNRNWLNAGQSLPVYVGDYNQPDKRYDDDFDDTSYENELLPYLYNDDLMEKRQGGRWALIHRQLHKLDSNKYKRFGDSSDEVDEVDKRMGSRWMLIQNKLRNLGGRSKRNEDDKRFMGRWKNQNWILSKGKQNSDMALSHNENKRNIGRWKNQNWILQQYRERKSNGKGYD